MDGFEASTSVDWQASGDVTLLKIKDNVDRVGHLQVQVHPITGDVKVTPDRDTALGNAVGGTDQTPFQYYSSGVLTGSCGTSIDHGVLPPNNNTNTFGLELKSEKTEDLDVDERNLLSVAYKNIGAKRASWRTLSGGFDDADEDLLNDYKRIVRKYIRCTEVLKLLTDHLCKNVEGNGDETEVFYLKMCGDYYRYLSEFRTDQENYKKSAEEFYKKAMDVAEANLNETHPTRLGLALNFSVCYYEILKEPEKACDLAKKSFDAAIEKLDTLNDASYKDSTLIMQLLRDNLTLWTSSNDEDDQ